LKRTRGRMEEAWGWLERMRDVVESNEW
jgi:hypothetical protein